MPDAVPLPDLTGDQITMFMAAFSATCPEGGGFVAEQGLGSRCFQMDTSRPGGRRYSAQVLR